MRQIGFAMIAGAALALSGAGAARAQQPPGAPLGTPEAIASFAATACVFDETADIAGPFKAVLKAARATGLPVIVENDTTGIYGELSGLNIIVTAGVDNLACVVKVPAAMIDHDGFEVLEAAISEAFETRHPGHLTSASDDPSPHADGRDWVLDTAAGDHIAASLNFATLDGVNFASVAQKTYE